ncbi:MAG: lipopolysaccharide biosynthesis protein [Muribaculaceae bacterium]|nr:lipopolysaccharide biosynthesis protein [Muribaculaceae bacterium]
MNSELKTRTANTLKWNTIDRVASQVLYGVSGIVLANLLSKEAFGLVGVLGVFQAFAILFVDSGFGSALLQKKDPDEDDYSTVFWFNLAVSAAVYAVLYFCAPLIASFFGAPELTALSRVMFLTFVLTGLGIVQTNRLMKLMDVKQIAIADLFALSVSACLGIALAVAGFGAWAIVWQSVALAGLKSGWLWMKGNWTPRAVFSRRSLSDIRNIGLSVFISQFFNTLFLNIYQFVIGKWYSLTLLAYYSQADKWSKMGSASLSQILTSSFVPLLAKVQDDIATFHRYMQRIDRFSALLAFPVLTMVAACGTSIFHFLFGTKWDAAIPLFQILCIRGIGVVFTALYSNFMMALGHGRQIVTVEIVKDATTSIALIATVFTMSLEALVWGQFAATLVTWIVAGIIAARLTGYRLRDLCADLIPFLLTASVAACAIWVVPLPGGDIEHPLNLPSLLSLAIQLAAGFTATLAVLALLRVPELPEAIAYIKRRSKI